MAVGIVASQQACLGIAVAGVGPDVHHAQRPGISDSVQAVFIAHRRVVDPFANLEIGEALAEVGERARHDGTLVSVGRIEGAVNRPGHVSSIVEHAFGDAAVAEDIGAGILLGLVALCLFTLPLVVSAVVHEARLRVQGTGPAAALLTLGRVAGAALMAMVACPARASGSVRRSGFSDRLVAVVGGE
jgi:hypothetical protein